MREVFWWLTLLSLAERESDSTSSDTLDLNMVVQHGLQDVLLCVTCEENHPPR